MTRWTLISATTDRELASIRRAVQVYDSVAGEPAIVELLRARAVTGDRVETLDLVGHSARSGFLRLGEWVLDDSAQTAGSFDVLIRPSLQRLGVREIRLLGCCTAISPRAWSALTQIACATRCRVLGTRRYIGLVDYRAEGFISDDALVGPPGARPERQDWIGFLPHSATLTPIRAIAMSAGPPLSNDQPLAPVNELVAHEILSHIDGRRSWVVPGLLAHPSPIVLWSEANTIHRLEILLDGHAARVYGEYPDDEHGRIYLVRNVGALNHLLEQLDHPRTEIRARRL